MKNSQRYAPITAALCGILSLAVYTRTMLPGPGGYGDTSKFQFIGKVLGLPHPSGFPTYIFVNALFAKLPWGTLAWRINLMSAIFGALTVAAVCLIAARLTKNPIAAALSSLFFAFSFTFWSTCVIAEVYTLAFFLIAATIYCLVRWRETLRRQWFYLACALFALSFGNHLMVIVLIPPFLLMVLATDRSIFRSGRAIATVSLIVLAAASQYLFLYFRSLQHPAYGEGAVRSLQELVSYATGGSFKRHWFEFSARQVLGISIPTYARLLAGQLTIFGVVCAAAGFVVFFIRDRVWASFFLLLYVITVALYVNGPHIEQTIYFVPATMVLAIAMAFIITEMDIRSPRGILFSILMAVTILITFNRNFPVEDLSGKTEYGEAADRVLDAAAPNSIILSPNYNWTEVLLYKLLGEDKRSGDGVYVLHHWEPGKLGDYIEGRVPSWDPYTPTAPRAGRHTLYLLALEEEPRDLTLIREAGWRAVPVIEQVPPLVAELRNLDDRTIVCAALKDEGTTFLSSEGYDAVNAIGLRTQAARGDTFGWAAADAAVRHDGRWGGWQHYRYRPVEISISPDDPIFKTPYSYPVAIEISCAGYGRGNRNEIRVSGKKLTESEHGLNIALIDRESGKPERVINVPPADLGKLRPIYLYKLKPPDGG